MIERAIYIDRVGDIHYKWVEYRLFGLLIYRSKKEEIENLS